MIPTRGDRMEVEIRIYLPAETAMALRPEGQTVLAELSKKYKVYFLDQKSLFTDEEQPTKKQTLVVVYSGGLSQEELLTIKRGVLFLVEYSFQPEDWGDLVFISHVTTRF